MTVPVSISMGTKRGQRKPCSASGLGRVSPLSPFIASRAHTHTRARAGAYMRVRVRSGGEFNGDNGDKGAWMGEAALKPGIRELVGIAVNKSNLTFRAAEGPLDRVAAIGAATLAVRLGADRQDVPIATAYAGMKLNGTPIDERDALHGELAADLLHIFEGQQLERLPTAVTLFSAWIVHRRLFAEYAGAEHAGLRRAFSERALHEWLSWRCEACGGTGKQEMLRNGALVRPRGMMQRNQMLRHCKHCGGRGRKASSPPQRMKALGLTREQYDEGRWDQRFSAAMTWLSELLPRRLTGPLTAELERRKRRTQSS